MSTDKEQVRDLLWIATDRIDGCLEKLEDKVIQLLQCDLGKSGPYGVTKNEVMQLMASMTRDLHAINTTLRANLDPFDDVEDNPVEQGHDPFAPFM